MKSKIIMIVQKSYIDNNGRLAIPAKIRQQLKLKIGDEVALTYNNSELIVSTFHSHLEKARNILDKYKNINTQSESTLTYSEEHEDHENN